MEEEEIKELELLSQKVKKREEGIVVFSEDAIDFDGYYWGGMVFKFFYIVFLSLLLFALFVGVYESVSMTDSLLKATGLVFFYGVFVVGFFHAIYEAVKEAYEGVIDYIKCYNYLVISQEYLEVYLYPFKFFKQRILINDIASIDIKCQRFLFGGKKVLVESIKRGLTEDKENKKYRYYSFNVNLKNQQAKILNFKLTDLAVAKQLGAYILTPHNLSLSNKEEGSSEDFVLEIKQDKLEVYSSDLLLNEEETEDFRKQFKMLVKLFVMFSVLFMLALKFVSLMVLVNIFLIMWIVFVPSLIKSSFLFLKNSRIKKIEITPSLLTESRIGLFSKSKNKFKLSMEEVDSFFVRREEDVYRISLILKKGISYDLPIQFKERERAEELLHKMQTILLNKDKVSIQPESDSSQIGLDNLEELLDRDVNDKNNNIG
jgi:hypothetical protein